MVQTDSQNNYYIAKMCIIHKKRREQFRVFFSHRLKSVKPF